METTPNGADALGRVRDALFRAGFRATLLAKSEPRKPAGPTG